MRQLDDISPFIRIELEGLDKHKWGTTLCTQKKVQFDDDEYI